MDKGDFVFDFERLDVYQTALAFANEVFTITCTFRFELQSSLGDQFRRAALSICNNLAEGSRKSFKSRKQFYDYALDSARECIPMIRLAVMQRQIVSDVELALRDQCVRICKMVYRLGQSVKL